MPRGPLPNPNSRRRNKPTIEAAELTPRIGPPPEVPEAYELGIAGSAFWEWAWALPQASKWDDGSLFFVARRAVLEDDLAALDEADRLTFVIDDMIAEAVAEDDPLNFKNRLTQLTLTFKKLKGLAGGRVSVMKEMRELDNRLGLNPKALGDLRWVIADPADQPDLPGGELNVKELKAELKKRGVPFSPKAKKAALQSLLHKAGDEAAGVAQLDDYRTRLG
ncbi:MAG TPA: hypothetical protein VD761_07780 [Solirubrobacterales bacterium]|nr:hypothetical protein [Solirubrobacterales bacterium]